MRPLPGCDGASAVKLKDFRRSAFGVVLALSLAFVAKAEPVWHDYQIIMWQQHNQAQNATLRMLGITAGAVPANRGNGGRPAPTDFTTLKNTGLGWYLENIATDFYASYHRYTPGKPENWRFLEAQKFHEANPADPNAYKREPSLSDPVWLDSIAARLREAVTATRAERPLFYNLGDETGIGDLAAFWDFDLSEPSLAGMRGWLKERYGSIEALNREWETGFSSWDSVVPMTTDQAMRRPGDNFAPWADFKAWMDVAFARALRRGTDAVHAADPDALAGIEGAQIPGWGGYDYSLLSHAVDLMEIYDFGGNVDIVRSLNPGMILLTTSFEGGPREQHRVWRELLNGTRGLILWDEKKEFVDGDGNPGTRGREAAPYFREIRGGLGKLIIGSRRENDPVAILYSPASMRTQWMTDWRGKGDAWSRRNAAAEYETSNAWRDAMMSYWQALRRLGLQPRFVSDDQLAKGEMQSAGYRILILPSTLSLSGREARAVREFAEQGGTVIADIEPGQFDEHSRRLGKPLLSDAAIQRVAADAPNFPGIVAKAGVQPRVTISGASDVALHTYRDGNSRIVALLRELAKDGQPTAMEAVSVKLPKPAFLYDLRKKQPLGRTDRIELSLPPFEPVLISISDTP